MGTARKIRAARAVALGLLAVWFGGCSVVDGGIGDRYATFNQELNNARNDEILLNILRSQSFEPLTFAPSTNVTGTMGGGLGFGLPGFAVGRDAPDSVAFGSATLNASRSAGASIQTVPLTSKEFYSGLMTPVSARSFLLLLRQGYSRELLFWLLADSVRATGSGGDGIFANDDSADLGCAPIGGGEPRCFKDFVDLAMQWGLTAEFVPGVKPAKDEPPPVRMCFDPLLGRAARAEIRPGERDWGAAPGAVACGGRSA